MDEDTQHIEDSIQQSRVILRIDHSGGDQLGEDRDPFRCRIVIALSKDEAKFTNCSIVAQLDLRQSCRTCHRSDWGVIAEIRRWSSSYSDHLERSVPKSEEWIPSATSRTRWELEAKDHAVERAMLTTQGRCQSKQETIKACREKRMRSEWEGSLGKSDGEVDRISTRLFE